MRERIFHAVCREFTLYRICGSRLRLAALHHKVLDNAVKGKTVVEAALCELNKICNGDRRSVRIKRYGDLTVIAYGNYCGAIPDALGGFTAAAEHRNSSDKDGDNKRTAPYKLRILHF